ncbi:MAG: hypothetical protein Ta2F_14570 [Termitinemataceae bacterium]|nr:MAG: hypothetical protein Ta2F_14570 [Termitinemataceae bacterium]
MFPDRTAKKVLALVIFALLSFPAFAQNGDDGGNSEDDRSPIISTWTDGKMSLYTKGDQLFWINLGVLLPLFITDIGKIDGVKTDTYGDKLEKNIKLGGAGSLSYSYFLNSHVYIGAELQGSFSVTKARKFLYMVPIALKAGYQFLAGRFEFPISLAIGGCTQTYDNENNLYSMFFKPQASAFFRFNPEWSFGLNADWWIVPQITKQSEHNAVGHFFEISLAARYHF